MRVLLDTHVAIWSVAESGRLPRRISKLLLDPRNEIHVSAVSIWEIAIKHPLGKRRGAPPFSAERAVFMFKEAGYGLIDVTAAHAAMVEQVSLPHSDPFDRLIVAQALSEPLRLVTRDEQIAGYSDSIITW